MRRIGIAVILLAAALAGCLQTDPSKDTGMPAVPEDWPAVALPYGDGHDHSDPAQHAGLSTPNFHVLGWDPLVTDYHGKTSGGYMCGDVAEPGDRRIAVVHSFTSDVALVLADVTDPTNPEKIGELVLPHTHVYDVSITPDAEFVALATSPLDTGPDEGPAAAVAVKAPFFRDACTGEEKPVSGQAVGTPGEAPYASGVVLVDVRDPANPEVVDYKPHPVLGAHSVFATEIDGTRWVLGAVTNLVHSGSYFTFYTIEETPAGPTLEPQGTYRPTPDGTDVPLDNGHVDGWIQKHPATGETLAYLADWSGGLVILDIANPAAPQEVGRWQTYRLNEGEGTGGSIHEAYPLDVLWDDRHYTIIGQEVGQRPRDSPTGVVSVMDTTDPANPTRVGAWTLPADVEWDGFLQFSTHYVSVVDRTLFVSMYHGGVWAVDLSDVTAPRTVGAFIPDNVSPSPPGALAAGFDWTPTVLEVAALSEGNLVVWDATSGVYTVHFDAANPAPPVDEWPIRLE